MKVLVTGSRHWPFAERDIIKDALIAAGATVVVHGDARGADTQAKVIAGELGITERPYPANWKRDGKAAGPIRNQEMLDKEHTADEPIARVLAFPMADSIGTYDMIERATAAGIRVTTYWIGPPADC